MARTSERTMGRASGSRSSRLGWTSRQTGRSRGRCTRRMSRNCHHGYGLSSLCGFFFFLTDRLQIVFKIPEQTPAGQYLMRMDLPWSGMINQYINHGDVLTQLYPSCAQLNIKSSATGSLPKGVKIPEIFSPDVLGAFVFLLCYLVSICLFCCKVWWPRR